MTDCNLHIWWVGLSSSVIPEKFKSTPTPLFEQPLNFIVHGVLLGDYSIPVVSCIVLNKQCPSITLLLLWQIHYYLCITTISGDIFSHLQQKVNQRKRM